MTGLDIIILAVSFVTGSFCLWLVSIDLRQLARLRRAAARDVLRQQEEQAAAALRAEWEGRN